jgi:hypothetical protein
MGVSVWGVFSKPVACPLCEARKADQRGFTPPICSLCAETQVPVMLRDVDILNDSIRIFNESKNPATRISRAGIVAQKVERLRRAHECGLIPINPPPDECMRHIVENVEIVFSDYTKELVDAARERSQKAKSDSAKRSPYTKAIERLEKLRADMIDTEMLDHTLQSIADERDAL